MVNKSDKNYQKFINTCVNFCKKSGMKTKESIFGFISEQLHDEYKDKVEKWKIDWFAEDVTESICLKMKIAC